MQHPKSEGDFPRSLRDTAEIERRKAMLRLPHIAPLADYVQALREGHAGEVPDFDPLDGGVEAKILFLFEKPGPMTSEAGAGKRIGSGFISRNNDDATAEATFHFMRTAQIPRETTVLWNSIPVWNGTRRVTSAELREAVARMKELLELLAELRAIVLVGRKAERLLPYLEKAQYVVTTSAHPSPLVKASSPDKWKNIGTEWAKVRSVVGA